MGWISALIGVTCFAASMFIVIKFLDQRKKLLGQAKEIEDLLVDTEDSRKIILKMTCRIAFEDWMNNDTQRKFEDIEGVRGCYLIATQGGMYRLICDEILPVFYDMGYDDWSNGKPFLASFDDEVLYNIRKSVPPNCAFLSEDIYAYCRDVYDVGYTETAETMLDNQTVH